MAARLLLFARGGGRGVRARALLTGGAEALGARLGQLALQLGQLQLQGTGVAALRGQQRVSSTVRRTSRAFSASSSRAAWRSLSKSFSSPSRTMQ
jgi:hypothetical protein